MITSANLIFSSMQAIAGASALSTNVIDLGATGTVLGAPTALTRDIGPGEPIALLVEVVTAFSGAGSLTVQVEAGDTTSMVGATVVAQTAALTTAQLGVAGNQISIGLLPNQINKRFLAINYALTAATSFQAGALTAGIVAGLQTNKAAGRA
jgi:hypothetical protein